MIAGWNTRCAHRAIRKRISERETEINKLITTITFAKMPKSMTYPEFKAQITALKHVISCNIRAVERMEKLYKTK